MEDEWWEKPVCILCDYWACILALLVVGITGYLTRDIWLPLQSTGSNLTSSVFPTMIRSTDTSHIIKLPSDATSVELCPGDVATLPWAVTISPSAKQTDILLAFDQTGSMASTIAEAKEVAYSLMDSINSELGNTHFGVAGFTDYPNVGGERGDFPYMLYQPITNDIASVHRAIDGLGLASGYDEPESYIRMMFESYSDPEIGWRNGGRKLLVIFGDSIPQDPDAGRDGLLHSSDDLTTTEVLTKMVEHGINLIFIANPGAGSELRNLWKSYTSITGGTIANMDTTSELQLIVKDAVKAVSKHINEMKVNTDPAKFKSWMKSDVIHDIFIGDETKEVTISLMFTLPVGEETAGGYSFKLEAVGDSAVYATRDFEVIIPMNCEN